MKSIQHTDDFLIEGIQRMNGVLGRPPVSYSEYQYKQTAISRFGSWENALQLAGLKMYAAADEGLEIRARYIREVKEINRVLVRTPRAEDFDDYRKVKYYFKTLGALYEAAGMKKKNNAWVIDKTL